MTEVLTVSNARKSFRETRALDGAALTLNRGERLALLGPNGARKTTLIRAIAGRVKLDEGTIRLLDRPLDASSPTDVRQRLGIVPQEIGLYPLLTARENLQVWGTLHGVPRSDLADRTRWALEWTGLSDRAEEPCKNFSGGMKRRLNIACAVLHRPDVILLDEPTAGVDPQSRQRIWDMLDELRAQGASLLLTTHQLDEAQSICDRIVIIDHGTVIADGTFHELLARTIGTTRQVTFEIEGDVNDALHADGFESADGVLHHSLENVAVELPQMLKQIEQAGARVQDLRIVAPSLQAVFIHLTGRELRE